MTEIYVVSSTTSWLLILVCTCEGEPFGVSLDERLDDLLIRYLFSFGSDEFASGESFAEY